MITCHECREKPAAKAIGMCADCLRNISSVQKLIELHRNIRKRYGLPQNPPKNSDGIGCNLCANNCRMAPGEKGYCGLRQNEDGKLIDFARRKGGALAYMYLDQLPTNCCAAWFCNGSKKGGYNLAVFFYGCNFDCMFCQNASHKLIKEAPGVTQEEMVQRALDPKVCCVCFFGGSPEPQLPFALAVACKIVKESGNSKHICWEWNGCGNPELVKKASELSAMSGGTVKFDLKCSDSNMSYALCGVSNQKAFENFMLIATCGYQDSLNATTLLVPYYVDKKEVEKTARFISRIGSHIPYSLLVFHPDFYMKDLPITPRIQVDECYQAATSYLTRVNIGNKHLLQYAK